MVIALTKQFEKKWQICGCDERFCNHSFDEVSLSSKSGSPKRQCLNAKHWTARTPHRLSPYTPFPVWVSGYRPKFMQTRQDDEMSRGKKRLTTRAVKRTSSSLQRPLDPRKTGLCLDKREERETPVLKTFEFQGLVLHSCAIVVCLSPRQTHLTDLTDLCHHEPEHTTGEINEPD